MPFLFSFLKSSRRMSQQVDGDGSGDAGFDGAETKERRRSKRDYFRSLLKRSNSDYRARTRLRVQSAPAVLRKESSKSSEIPISPMADSNKPLPPAPPAASTLLPALDVPPAEHDDHDTTPIAKSDLHKLFSGAPQFFARSEGHHTTAPHPSVAFPWDTDVDIRDLCDHVQIQDEAWRSVTAWPHITRDVSTDTKKANEHHERRMPRFLPRCRERPNMLKMQGLEKGTIGFQAALELGIADALVVPAENTVEGLRSRSECRRKFLSGKEGLRPVTDTVLIQRLINLSTAYHSDAAALQRPAVELYTELFTQVLFPPSRVTDADDPYSLQVQIEALVTVLANAVVWIDFSLVEWRIRLGNLLWGPLFENMTEEELEVASEAGNDPGTEKYWLLLQILLSCELLVRLDALSSNPHSSTIQDLHRFEKSTTSSVKWSLILARQWLENIRTEKPPDPTETDKASTGWLAVLSRSTVNRSFVNHGIDSVKFLGRNQTRQLSGLLHFARKLKWPHLDALTTKVAANGISTADSTYSTPVLGTPLSISTQRSSSYFSSGRPRARRGLSTQQRMSTIMQPPGWLSNSYINNLVLPGEGLSHFLISTLLENDEAAIARLGEEANLYCGFSYEGKSFWSTACIVGRVLAAGYGASECMGWIGSEVVPNGPAGWVDIDVQQNEANHSLEHARIWQKKRIEHDGDVIGGSDASSVTASDFSLPSDELFHQLSCTKFEGLDLLLESKPKHSKSSENPSEEPPPSAVDDGEVADIQSYSAMMRFSIETGGQRKTTELPLRNDVYFVTAHPCVASRHTEFLKSPTSPLFQVKGDRLTSSRELYNGHPLHKSFGYVKAALVDLLTAPTLLSISEFLEPAESHGPTAADFKADAKAGSIPKVLVIDCVDSTLHSSAVPKSRHSAGSDLEMLARAYCADKGWNALISRRTRGCLACAIREAGALAWRVVLRFE